MTSLQKLYLNRQKTLPRITDLPVSWSGMTALQELYLQNNKIVNLPPEWSNLMQLWFL